MRGSRPDGTRTRRADTHHVVLWGARLLAAAGLALDASVHADLAPQYDLVTAAWSEGSLFRVEAALASLAALLVLVWPRLVSYAFGFVVAVGGLGLILVYRYEDLGELGPLPDMYEPVWFTEKWIAVIGQSAAIVGTSVLLLSVWHSRRTRGRDLK